MAEIGDNRPDYATGIAAQFPADFAHLSAEVAEHEIAALALPEEITDKDSHDKTVDLIATMKTAANKIEAIRIAEKDPFLRAERAVDGFFNPILDILIDKRKGYVGKLTMRVTAYLQRKAAAERAAAEERARVERERAAAIRREQEIAEARAAEARRAATKATREAEAARLSEQAQEVENRAAVLTEAAASKPADSKARTDKGSLSGLKTDWTFEVEDYTAIDLNLLRAYIGDEAINKALKAFVKINKDRITVPGVRFFETESAQIRRGA